MTGFGEAHAEVEGVRIAVEVRTVNNRHLKLSFRGDAGYNVLEPQVEALVRQRVRRGGVNLNLKLSRSAADAKYRVNAEVLSGYHQQLRDLPPGFGEATLDTLLALPGVIEDARDDGADPREQWSVIQPVVAEALDALQAMRLGEGKALAADLLDNCERIADELTGVEQRAPQVAEGYKSRLVERVNQALSDLNVTVDPADLVREVAVFADRSDISEETVRLRSHIEQFAAAVNGAEGGRKLEFIAQEMGRETNTIGSKASDAEISQRVVAIKTALERIREQVQNVE